MHQTLLVINSHVGTGMCCFPAPNGLIALISKAEFLVPFIARRSAEKPFSCETVLQSIGLSWRVSMVIQIIPTFNQ